MENINTLLAKSTNYLKKNEILTAGLDSELLLSKIINKPREYLFLNPNRIIDKDNVEKFQFLIERRKKKEPIAYILNKKDFWKSTFYVDKNVLIPRPDTEILIQEALYLLPKDRRISVLDIGTGSGCIILSLLQENKHITGFGIDISKKALKVANFNAKIHQLQNRVRFFKSSVDNFFKGKYDLIVSNPPYINKIDFKYLEKDVSGFEPIAALKGGNDGLSLIRKVVERSSKLLKKGGKFILEIGHDQKLKVKSLLKKKKFYVKKIVKDYGKKNRCIICIKL